jgi:hypothetical protein
MTQDEIIEIARQAGFNHGLDDPIIYAAHERFAILVAAKEREACAMECIKLAHGWARLGAWGENNEFHDCATAIRARGQA